MNCMSEIAAKADVRFQPARTIGCGDNLKKVQWHVYTGFTSKRKPPLI